MKRPRWHYGLPIVINFASVFLSFCANILLARLIAPAAFGVFAIWQNNAQLFGTLGTFGQMNYVLRELAHTGGPRTDESRAVAKSAVVLSIAASIVLGAAGALFFAAVQHGSVAGAGLQLVATLMIGLLFTLSAVHRGMGSLVTGLVFDRLVYQVPFVLLLLFGGALLAGSTAAMAVVTALMAIAAAASVAYLLHRTGPGLMRADVPRSYSAEARAVLPFFVVNCLFVVNARYLLSYFGIFLKGEILGQIGFAFTLVAVMIIPISTLNLVAGPYLARRVRERGGERITLAYLGAVAAMVVAGVLVVVLAQPLFFSIARMELTLPVTFILLLATAIGVTCIGNAGLIILQFRGRAGEAANLFSFAIGAKLVGGFFVASYLGMTALLWADILIGVAFLAVLLIKVLAPAKATGSDLPEAAVDLA
jgi:O-antigen/teichoic acid export membrane protein